jgi:hypothetical protein
MSLLTYDVVARQLVQRVPEFDTIFQTHLQECGQVLPHVLFGNLVAFTKNLYRTFKQGTASAQNSLGVLIRTLDFIEEAAHSQDPKVIDLLLSSFMEIFDLSNTDDQSITVMLGPESQKLLRIAKS